MTSVNGVTIGHIIVTDSCRQTHGDSGAGLVACQKIYEAYIDLLEDTSPVTDKRKFHIILIVEDD
jgi:hypothetical protein